MHCSAEYAGLANVSQAYIVGFDTANSGIGSWKADTGRATAKLRSKGGRFYRAGCWQRGLEEAWKGRNSNS
jgi:hypothetical protein